MSMYSRYRSVWPCDSLPWLVSRTTSTTSPSCSISDMNDSIMRGLGDGGHQDRHVRAVLFVAIDVVAEAGAGDDFQVVRRADGVAELEVAVAGDAEVGFQLRFGELAEAARGRGWCFVRGNTFVKKFFRNPIAASRVGVRSVIRLVGNSGDSSRRHAGGGRAVDLLKGRLRQRRRNRRLRARRDSRPARESHRRYHRTRPAKWSRNGPEIEARYSALVVKRRRHVSETRQSVLPRGNVAIARCVRR